MNPDIELDSYPWDPGEFNCSHEHLLPKVDEILTTEFSDLENERVLDLGCGNRAVTGWLAKGGCQAVGVDPSAEGVRRAQEAHPDLEFRQASTYDSIREELGTFTLAVSLEFVEHVYDPPRFARTGFKVLSPGGVLVVSTPYHGWVK